MIPAEYAWLQPVLVPAAIVFIISLISNHIVIASRFVNALLTTVIYAGVFGALIYYGYGAIDVNVSMTPSTDAPAYMHMDRSEY